jgi:hypothetical protein
MFALTGKDIHLPELTRDHGTPCAIRSLYRHFLDVQIDLTLCECRKVVIIICFSQSNLRGLMVLKTNVSDKFCVMFN